MEKDPLVEALLDADGALRKHQATYLAVSRRGPGQTIEAFFAAQEEWGAKSQALGEAREVAARAVVGRDGGGASSVLCVIAACRIERAMAR